MIRGVSVIFLAVLLAVAQTPAGRAAGPVVLAVDTVWSGSVEVAAETVVAAGATLLILPGTTVRFAKGTEGGEPPVRLLVNGTLVAQGTPGEPIVFTSAAPRPQPGDWGGIAFDRAPGAWSRLRHCRVEYAATGIAGTLAAVVVEDCELARNRVALSAAQKLAGGLYRSLVRDNEVGLYFNQSEGFLVEDSRIQQNTVGGVACVNGSAPRIVNCRIENNARFGVSCVQGASPLLSDNEIRGHERGVHVELKSSPVLARNSIRDNQTGVWAEKLVFPRLEGNVITGNRVGIYCNFSAYPQLRNNDLSGNATFALVLGDNQSIEVEQQIPFRDRGQNFAEPPADAQAPPPQARKFTPFRGATDGTVDARGNWWGAEATGQMKTLGEKGNVTVIEDGRDKPDTDYLGKRFARDVVAFSPWAEQPPTPAGRVETRYAGVRGKVVLAGQAAPGARVFAYETAEGDFRGQGAAFSAPAGVDGSFSLSLRPGRYFLVAKRSAPPFPAREPGPGELFGYYGGNPVLVGAGSYREANVFAVERRPVEAAPGPSPEAAVLEGLVLGPEGPLEGAFLYVYPDASRDFRGPDLFGPQGAVLGGTGADGRFSVEVPPGRYFLVAAKRTGGRGLGPLQVGDFFGYFDGNPVAVAAGERRRVTVQAAEKARDTGGNAAFAEGLLSIRGVIRDPEEKVPQGVYAYASRDPNFMTGTMPPFRSSPVGPDGAYFVDLPGPGTYYVGARSGYGGPPLPGEWFGVHGEALPVPVVVEADAPRAGVNITVRRME